MVHQSEGQAAGLNLLNDSSSGDLPNRDWQNHASAPPQHPSWWATVIALALLIVMAPDSNDRGWHTDRPR